MTSVHQFKDLYDTEIPIPALERGWLHSRKLVFPWNVERIAETIGERCWFSRYHRDSEGTDPEELKFKMYAIAGFWPAGGFVELKLAYSNPLDDPPKCYLGVYAESPAKAEALMDELIKGYCHEVTRGAKNTRIGILNMTARGLNVEQVKVAARQVVAREQANLYYGEGAGSWVDQWLDALHTRQYGLTLLTGAPGTGKTTLVRSLAHWLRDTHMVYFMSAARFADVESGEVVSFMAMESRCSRKRKVLVLEDAESVLQRRAGDNREKVATLLNLTDGMLGDALGLHIVCTLNSELTELDPALLRPGRLVAHRDFCQLTSEEAKRLAAVVGLETPDSSRVSLADLFNPASGVATTSRAPRRAIGFNAVEQAVRKAG